MLSEQHYQTALISYLNFKKRLKKKRKKNTITKSWTNSNLCWIEIRYISEILKWKRKSKSKKKLKKAKEKVKKKLTSKSFHIKALCPNQRLLAPPGNYWVLFENITIHILLFTFIVQRIIVILLFTFVLYIIIRMCPCFLHPFYPEKIICWIHYLLPSRNLSLCNIWRIEINCNTWSK